MIQSNPPSLPSLSSLPSLPPLPLGRLVSTPGAIHAMATNAIDPVILLQRHRTGDWGELDPEDWAANDAARRNGGRILSAYHLDDKTTLWVITEADRNSTCILRPDEY